MKQAIIFAIVAAIIIAGAMMYTSNRQPLADVESGRQGIIIDDSRHDLGMDQLKIEDVKVGTGAEAVAGKTVTVHYVGTFESGKKFDASRDHGSEGFSFALGAGQVIQGWEQGVAGMKVGGVRKLVVPYELAYGERDVKNPYTGEVVIPAKSTLLFEVELLAVK
jgi:FKBP-type peptidyl-prolyl cis-trans isomerase FkpA